MRQDNLPPSYKDIISKCKEIIKKKKMIMNKKDLIDFEEEIADLFNKGKIRAPVHLYQGNEDKIIDFFKRLKANDWIFCSWRSHYQCLLKVFQKMKLRKKS